MYSSNMNMIKQHRGSTFVESLSIFVKTLEFNEHLYNPSPPVKNIESIQLHVVAAAVNFSSSLN